MANSPLTVEKKTDMPPPESTGPEAAFKLLRELYDNDVSDSENKPPSRTTRKDHSQYKEETEKTGQQSDYEFADISDPEKQYDLIMDKIMNMDEEEYQAYKKKHPWPGEFQYPSVRSDDGK